MLFFLEKIKQLSPANQTSDFEKDIKLHRLVYEAPDLIDNTEEEVETKRLVLSQLFSNFELKGDKMRAKYTSGGRFLAE